MKSTSTTPLRPIKLGLVVNFSVLLLLSILYLFRSQPPILILVSLDGFHPTYLNYSTFLSQLQGTSTPYMIPSYPSSTFPNHYSIVTGLYPEEHGIIANKFYDYKTNKTFVYTSKESAQEKYWWGGLPIWKHALNSGVTTATMMWPGSEVPENTAKYYEPFSHYLSIKDKVDKVKEWFLLDDTLQFVTIYLPEVDSAGHTHGPHSQGVKDAIKLVDEGLAYLKDTLVGLGIYHRTNLIFVSDHGMAEMSDDKVILLDSIDGLLDSSKVTLVDNHIFVLVYPKDINQTNDIYKQLKSSSDGVEGYKVALDKDLSPSFHFSDNERISPILLLADFGWVFSPNKDTKLPKGQHGYNNTLPEMRAFFLASGPSWPIKQIAPFENIELYEMFCNQLEIYPNINNGTTQGLIIHQDI